jgi:E3 ubiquitin-protein ligase HUWE1
LKDKGYEDVLAREALYRCNNNLSYAEEYCEAQQVHALPNPIPIYENQSRRLILVVLPAEDSDATPPNIGNGAESAQARIAPPVAAHGESLTEHVPHVEVEEAEGDETPATSMPPPPPAPGVPSETNGAEGDEFLPMVSTICSILSKFPVPMISAPAVPPLQMLRQVFGKGNETEASKLPEVVTVDDLDSERSGIRMCLIDRSLDVINVHSDVTFELADLITAAVAKAGDPASMRREIERHLCSHLFRCRWMKTSDQKARRLLRMRTSSPWSFRIKEFYDATLDELKDNFTTLLGFIKIFSDQPAEEASPWIGQILLIIEKMLAEDAQPQQIKWTPPSSDDTRAASPIAELEGPIIPLDEKYQLSKQ